MMLRIDVADVLTAAGALVMTLAAFLFDWRAGVWLIGCWLLLLGILLARARAGG